jgi:hypothetical protein
MKGPGDGFVFISCLTDWKYIRLLLLSAHVICSIVSMMWKNIERSFEVPRMMLRMPTKIDK